MSASLLVPFAPPHPHEPRARLDGMRLLVASDTWAPQLNGVSRTLERLVAAARARGAEVRILTTTDPGAADVDPHVRRERSVPFWAYPQLRLAAPSARELARTLRDWRATLVHVATPFGVGLAARRAARLAGVPLVTSYHTSLSEYARFYHLGAIAPAGWRYLRWFHDAGGRTYCPTLAIASELARHHFRETAIWGRGVDTQHFSPTWRALSTRRALGIGDRELLVSYVGRVAREKGIDTLTRAMQEHRRAGAAPRARLMIVGDGPHLAACRRAAPADTVFTGRREGRDLARLYAASDLFVFPSITDTFGNVVLEAMASGVPVLAADCAVTRELAGGWGGRFFRPGDALDLASEVVRLGSDPALRFAAALKGRRRAESMSWDSVFDGLFRDYLAVIEATPKWR